VVKALAMSALVTVGLGMAAATSEAVPLGTVWHDNASARGLYSNAKPLGLVAINIPSIPVVAIQDTQTASGYVANVGVPAGTPAISATALAVNAAGELGSGPNAGGHANSYVANLSIVPAGLGAAAVYSECHSTMAGNSGFTTIVGGTGALAPVALNPPPNTTIPLGILTIVLNEQLAQDSVNPNGSVQHAIRVRAIHITFGAPGSGEIIVAESSCRASGPPA
jgi:hypothetical protein